MWRSRFSTESSAAVYLQTGWRHFAALRQSGYSLTDNSSDTFVALGVYLFCVRDDGNFDAGSIGPNGALGSFKLKALSAGLSSVTTSAVSPSKERR